MTGRGEVIARPSMGVHSPDDVVYLRDGTLAVTEPLHGRVSMLSSDGSWRTLSYDLPAVNGIATDPQRRRLFVNEFRPGGRLLELDPSGRAAPEVLISELDQPNGMASDSQGRLYFPLVDKNEVWCYDPSDGSARDIVRGLAKPTAVKIAPDGRLLVTEAATGDVTAIDIGTDSRVRLAALDPALDNLVSAADGRVYVSNFDTGRVTALQTGGQQVLSPGGLMGPYCLEAQPDGTILVADGVSLKLLARDGRSQTLSRCIVNQPWIIPAASQPEPGVVVIISPELGVVEWNLSRRQRVLAGPAVLETPSGLVADPGTVGQYLVCDRARGNVMAVRRDGRVHLLLRGLDEPLAVARGGDGRLWVTQARKGVAVFADGVVQAEIPEFAQPEGVAVSGGTAVIADPGSREIVAVDTTSYWREVLVRNAPIGPLDGRSTPFAFCPVAADPVGGFLVGCNGEGSIMRLTRKPQQ
jgi:sugar lactone lactonase YvrE